MAMALQRHGDVGGTGAVLSISQNQRWCRGERLAINDSRTQGFHQDPRPLDGRRPRGGHGLSALAQVLCYILEVSDHVEREALQALIERELGPQAKEAIVTAGQQLIEQGRREGRRDGECALLLCQLRRRFGTAVNTDIEQRITTASIEQRDPDPARPVGVTTRAGQDCLG